MSIVFVVSAPSGSGKSTLVNKLLERDEKLLFSISYTTRKPRGAERDGESYCFVSKEEFEEMIAQDEFLEWAEVFGNYYGTHRSILDKGLEQGCDVVLDIDVQGARQLKRKVEDSVSIFILAPSRAILEQRLRNRSEDAEAVIQRRLREAAEEIRGYTAYDYVLVNREIECAVETLHAIVKAERTRRCRVETQVQPILATFEGVRE
jgi:guanylate kinase